MPRLSVCIPTYNRSEYLAQVLESLKQPGSDRIEVVISDNGSTDNTSEVIAKYRTVFPCFKVHQWGENTGFDRNILKVLQSASGEYCWLLGDDDAVVPGAIQKVVNEIDTCHDIYLLNRIDADIHLVPQREKHWLSTGVHKNVFQMARRGDIIEYTSRAQSIGALYSFLSSLVIRRELFLPYLSRQEEMVGTGYSHVFILMAMMKDGAVLKYVDEPLVLCRWGNDRWETAAEVAPPVRGFERDAVAYIRFIEQFFGSDKEVCQLLLKVLAKEHPWYKLIYLRSLADIRYWEKLLPIIRKVGYTQREIIIAELVGGSEIVRRTSPIIGPYIRKLLKGV